MVGLGDSSLLSPEGLLPAESSQALRAGPAPSGRVQACVEVFPEQTKVLPLSCTPLARGAEEADIVCWQTHPLSGSHKSRDIHTCHLPNMHFNPGPLLKTAHWLHGEESHLVRLVKSG